MFKLIKDIIKKYREQILYIIIGGLTTVVSLLSYYISTRLFLNPENPLQLQIANVISWICAVTFAFFTNRSIVFKSHNKIIVELIRFYSSRLFTLFVEMGFMALFVTALGIDDRFSKLAVQFIIFILNYILSKLLVFKDDTILHLLYTYIGYFYCKIRLIFWVIRDKISGIKSDSVLFVAHPDDDTLFFHTFIKENKPYVCLMTTGYSLRRLPCFFRVMKQYGVKYRAYPLDAREKRSDVLTKNAKSVLSIKDFKTVATHNEFGEYGHEEHKRVHLAVINALKGTKFNGKVLCPVEKDKLTDYPLGKKSIKEKEDIFNKLYYTESWVLTEQEAGTPPWVKNEHLEEFDYK